MPLDLLLISYLLNLVPFEEVLYYKCSVMGEYEIPLDQFLYFISLYFSIASIVLIAASTLFMYSTYVYITDTYPTCIFRHNCFSGRKSITAWNQIVNASKDGMPRYIQVTFERSVWLSGHVRCVGGKGVRGICHQIDVLSWWFVLTAEVHSKNGELNQYKFWKGRHWTSSNVEKRWGLEQIEILKFGTL